MQIEMNAPRSVYMWDTGRKMALEVPFGADLTEVLVSFARERDRDALTVRPEWDSCGHAVCEIPGQLLDVPGTLNVCATVGGYVAGECRISVKRRAKPSDYVYTPAETVTVAGIEKTIKAWVEEKLASYEPPASEPDSMTSEEVDELFREE